MKYWLLKSEPDVFSIKDLENRGAQGEPWDGVRNYQARNFMRDAMKTGDRALFYHSRCETPGVVGVMEVIQEARPDPTARDPKSDYYDPRETKENPRWVCCTFRHVETFPRTVSLSEIKADHKLSGMRVAQRGNRLSITPVTQAEYEHICRLARESSPSVG